MIMKFLVLILSLITSSVFALTNVDRQEISSLSFNTNGGFENNVTGYYQSSAGTLINESTIKHSGNRAGKFQGLTGDYIETPVFQIATNTQYLAKFWYQSTSGFFTAALYTDANVLVTYTAISLASCTSYCEANVPVANLSGNYKLRITYVGGGAGIIYLDDIFVGRTDSPSNSSGLATLFVESGHGRTVGYPLTPVYTNGVTWINAKADSATTLATHVIIQVLDANRYVVAKEGKFILPAHGLTAGMYYFTSASSAGALTTLEPTNFSNPVLYVIDANTIDILNWRASTIGTPVNRGLVETAVNYVANDTNFIVGVTNTSVSRQVTAPPANSVGAGFIFIVKDESGGASTHNIYTIGSGTDTIDSSASVPITADFGVLKIYSDGASKWYSL
jgi:hypothetical protein